MGGFPNVVGCVDGSLIPILGPSIDRERYRNRKGQLSINIQVCFSYTYLIQGVTKFCVLKVCVESSGLFTNVDASYPGSTHDSRIFSNSGAVTVDDAYNDHSYRGDQSLQGIRSRRL